MIRLLANLRLLLRLRGSCKASRDEMATTLGAVLPSSTAAVGGCNYNFAPSPRCTWSARLSKQLKNSLTVEGGYRRGRGPCPLARKGDPTLRSML
jgi:hypothetical protein